MTEKTAVEKIKEILDENAPKNSKNDHTLNYSFSEASDLIRDAYVLWLKTFVLKKNYWHITNAKEIAKKKFEEISDKNWED